MMCDNDNMTMMITIVVMMKMMKMTLTMNIVVMSMVGKIKTQPFGRNQAWQLTCNSIHILFFWPYNICTFSKTQFCTLSSVDFCSPITWGWVSQSLDPQ